MYESLGDNSISRGKSANVILVSYISVSAGIMSFWPFFSWNRANRTQCSVVYCLLLQQLGKESGNQEKKRHAAQHNFSFWPNKEKRKDDDKDEANIESYVDCWFIKARARKSSSLPGSLFGDDTTNQVMIATFSTLMEVKMFMKSQFHKLETNICVLKPKCNQRSDSLWKFCGDNSSLN